MRDLRWRRRKPVKAQTLPAEYVACCCQVPPLFLRFLNLLVNDAIFLLDEGLNYMRTIQVSSSPGLTSKKIVATR
jgi:hypothetical protein